MTATDLRPPAERAAAEPDRPARGRAAARAAVTGVRRRRARRTLLVCLVLVVLIVVVLVASMITGDVPLTVGQVWYALTGRGTAGTNFIVYQLRLPRIETGLLTGACFGVAGAIFQSLVRNPLASPDIIGVSYGASAGGVVAILVLGWSGFALSGAALVGGLAVAAAIYLLAWRDGISGYRFVLIGIGLSAVLASVINYAITRAQVFEAQSALVWLTGSLNGASVDQFATLLPPAAVLLVAALVARRWLSGLQLGDELAVATGVPVERARLVLILIGVALAAVATAAVGPIGFVAFVAGPIARRLTRGTGDALVAPALVGALVVTAADYAGQHLLPVTLPVGVITPLIGAPYLLWLLITSGKTRFGGS
ncbi:iron complex transport system permease protein [Friedmanniella endophytica]|uniref:Iron complex transport system permease protein n=1 Tax=Microlunatus kandeliicorticis TaxID=1759536 RepID=A0A7W3IRS5_9ACTN|nr:iron chelate uptake ABC transporter family permease subunit [Microlunatus kandeliicorticis]MBA8794015.1 iron complex transport system permease protein [Microlunatus kandeliicorticis]